MDETSESVNEVDDTCVLSCDKEVDPKGQGLPDVCNSNEKVEKQASHDSDKDSSPADGAALDDEAKTAKLPSDTDVGEENDVKPPDDTDECLEDESEQEDVFKEEQTVGINTLEENT